VKLARLIICVAWTISSTGLMAATSGASGTSGVMNGLERFIDGIMERSIVAGETVGATVAVVQNGRLVVARGYGTADIGQGVAVRSRITQFRIGSISKLFVWMSVLQLVEAGKLDLDADINTYLTNFEIPARFAEPITMRHLMTHTPGFEENLINLFVSGPRQVGSLVQTLARDIPRRVRLPGSLVSYSNYGAALAGHVVAQISGQSWDEYVETHIFEPLGMAGATTRQPVPKSIDATRAKGYINDGGDFVEQGFTYVPLAPAGAATATALDIAQLMVQLLNPQSTSVLSATSKAQLLGGAYIAHPLVNGMTLGMYEMTRGGTRAVGHDGSTLLFNSSMILWPDEAMGLFVSTNTAGGEKVVRALVDTVAAHLGFSSNTATLQEVRNATPFTGDYIGARRNLSNFSKVMGLADTVRVSYQPAEGALQVVDNTGSHRYRQLQDNVFQQVGGAQRIVFKGQAGKITDLYFSNRPMIGYSRAGRAQTPLANAALIVAWFVLIAGVVLVWPVSSVTHRGCYVVRGQRFTTILTYLSCGVVLMFFWQLGTVAGGPYELMTGGFRKIPPLLWYPVVFAGLVLLRLVYFARVWVDGYWWLSRRFHFTGVLLVDCALLAWFWYWNLLPDMLLDYLKPAI